MKVLELILFALLTLISTAQSFDLSEQPLVRLPQAKPLIGIHQWSEEEKTPPSTQITNWWFLVKRNSDDAAKIGNSCPDDAIICAETVVVLDNDDKNKKPTVSQLISFTKHETVVAFEEGKLLARSKTQWGEKEVDLEILLSCDLDAKDDVIQWTGHDGHTFTDSMQVNWTNSGFCTVGDLERGGRIDRGRKHNDDSLGWFTTLFLFSLVVFAGYLVGQAWLNTSTMGSSSDFMNELFDVIVENLSNIPRFIGEIVSKITGSGNRGGYSAV